MTDHEIIQIVQAHKDGKEIQERLKCCPHLGWKPWHCWDFQHCDYRIAPQPRECWVNIYPVGRPYYETKRDADNAAGVGRTECVHFREVTEGE